VHEFAALAARAHEGVYAELGALMNASQASLMLDYENGCAEILDVVRLAREAGAEGSRATGAGWGGSTVHLVREDRVDKVLEALRTHFYKKRWPDLGEEELEQSLLVSDPASGAGLMLLD
jgi:galactokinase